MLYELITGQLPFGEGVGALAQHVLSEPTPPSRLAEGVPPALDALVMRLLAKRPRERLGYAVDVAAALVPMLSERAARGTSPAARTYLYRPEFAGRADLLAKFESHLDRAAAAEGGLVLMAGESGAGKTRLASEIATTAARRGFRVVTGECVPIQAGAEPSAVRGAPLHPLRPFLQAVADQCLAAGPTECERLLGPRGALLALYEPSIARLPLSDGRVESAHLPTHAARERIITTLLSTLLAFCEREPLLLVIDDLQWADDLSLALLSAFATAALGGVRMLLVGTYRSEEVTPALRQLADAPGVAQVRLSRLDEPTVAAMVGDMLALPEPPDGFVRFLTAQSDGNPFFVAEYLRTAVGGGLLRRNEEGRWEVIETPHSPESFARALPLPGVVRDLVSRRLAGLSASARQLAEAAAVLGREFSTDLLAATLSMDEIAQLEATEELRTCAVIEDGSEGTLRFTHDKLREVAYEGIDPTRRRALHRAAAAAIEARLPAFVAPERFYPALAHHFAMAGNHDKTLEYLERAGEHAARTGANVEAADLFRRALELDARLGHSSDSLRRARWERMAGEALFGLGDIAGSKEHLLRALACVGAEVPASRVGWSLLLAGELARQGAHLVSRARAARAGRLGTEALLLAALASGRLAECFYWEQNVKAMVATSLLSVNLAERAGRSNEVKRNYAQLAYLAGLLRAHPLARRYFRRALGGPEAERDDPAGVAFALCLESMYGLTFGDWERARASAARAVEIQRIVGDRQELEIALTLRAQPDFYTARFAETLPTFAEVRASARERANVQHDAWGAFARARSLIPLGRLDEAESLLIESLCLLRSVADRPSEILCHGLLAQARRLRGDLDGARVEADEVLALARGVQPTVYSEAHGYEGAAEVYLDLWAREMYAGGRNVDTFARRAHEALGLLRTFARVFPLGAPAALRCAGRVQHNAGRQRIARALFMRSARLAARMGMPFEEACAWLELARTTGSGEAQRRAAALFEGLGCERHARMAQEIARTP